MKKKRATPTSKAMILLGTGLLMLTLLFTLAAQGVPAYAQTAASSEVADDDADDAAEGADVPISGSALLRASAVALDYIGEGRVTETEVGDEEGYYEVEITRDNGSQVDVHLDEYFVVLGHEND